MSSGVDRQRHLKAFRGDQVKSIINPTGEKSRGPTKNYSRENRAALNKLANSVKEENEKQLAASQAPLFKMNRFKQVQPQVHNKLQEKLNTPNPHPFLRRQSKNSLSPTNINKNNNNSNNNNEQIPNDQEDDEYENVNNENQNNPDNYSNNNVNNNQFEEKERVSGADIISPFRKEKLKPQVPRTSNIQKSNNVNQQPSNFIRDNALTVINTVVHKNNPLPKEDKHNSFGKLPKYLVDRKAEMEEVKAKKALEEQNKDCPPGMVKMPEEERLKTLTLLEQNRKNVENELSAFPLRISTISRQKAKDALMAKLDEIEGAIKLFSRKVVYITQ